MVVAVLDIHMEINQQASIKPSSRRGGLTPMRWMITSATRGKNAIRVSRQHGI